jgi:hypothetical protein
MKASIAAVHESVVGTFRTRRRGLAMSAIGVSTDLARTGTEFGL